jgi:hypothetical protein
MVSETMVKGKVPALRLGPATRRALQLDALAAILPMDRRDWLAELVTDDDFETLRPSRAKVWGETALGRSRRISPILEIWADAATGPRLRAWRRRRSR